MQTLGERDGTLGGKSLEREEQLPRMIFWVQPERKDLSHCQGISAHSACWVGLHRRFGGACRQLAQRGLAGLVSGLEEIIPGGSGLFTLIPWPEAALGRIQDTREVALDTIDNKRLS